MIDPQNKLSDAIKADYNLGLQLTDRSGGAPLYTEVSDYNKLYTMLDQAIATTGHGNK
jgi:hypothetical protein